MKKLIILIVLTVMSCKQADHHMDNLAVEDNYKSKAEENFDEDAFYESYLREQFLDLLEANKLRNSNDNLFKRSDTDLPIAFYQNDSLVNLKLDRIHKKSKYSSILDDLDFNNYHYNYQLRFWNNKDKKEYNYSGIWSVNKDFLLIENDSIPTIKIIW